MPNKRKVSIIIPCYNEQSILEKNSIEIKKIMDTTKFDYDVILIDDKSQDRTVEIAQKIVSKYKNFKLMCHKKNMGRGGTVSEGIKSTNSDIVGFIDIDLETPEWYLPKLISSIKDGADVATANRIYKFNFGDFGIIHRWVSHKAYKRLVKMLLKTKLKDTETGCKFFNREKILPVLDLIKDKHWFWDTEIMVRSYYKGLKIIEIPTVFIRKKEISSSLNFVKDTMDYIKNLLSFRKELKKEGLI
jgi:hypothetical protein